MNLFVFLSAIAEKLDGFKQDMMPDASPLTWVVRNWITILNR